MPNTAGGATGANDNDFGGKGHKTLAKDGLLATINIKYNRQEKFVNSALLLLGYW